MQNYPLSKDSQTTLVDPTTPQGLRILTLSTPSPAPQNDTNAPAMTPTPHDPASMGSRLPTPSLSMTHLSNSSCPLHLSLRCHMCPTRARRPPRKKLPSVGATTKLAAGTLQCGTSIPELTRLCNPRYALSLSYYLPALTLWTKPHAATAAPPLRLPLGSPEPISSWGSRLMWDATLDSTPLSFDFSVTARVSTTPTPSAKSAPTKEARATDKCSTQTNKVDTRTSPADMDAAFAPLLAFPTPFLEAPLQETQHGDPQRDDGSNRSALDINRARHADHATDYFAFFSTPPILYDPPHYHKHVLPGQQSANTDDDVPIASNYRFGHAAERGHGGGAPAGEESRALYDANMGRHPRPRRYTTRAPMPPDLEYEALLAIWKMEPRYEYFKHRL
ncbi:hypothetical protein C8T65DRAFT_738626 [Cerioporus squamosus]|nr:hypothetical protein C8T65DRAFT_738626 [Cerioporus squamosus]